MITFLKRISKWGIQIMLRNGEIFLANIFVLFLTILLFNFLFLFSNLKNYLILKLNEKADVSVYFKEGVLEEEILNLKKEISNLPQVENVSFISAQEALQNFLKFHEKDQNLKEIVEELNNPFLASLRIVAKDPGEYEKIINFFEKEKAKKMVENIDYFERKPLLEKVSSFSKTINKIGFSISAILISLSILIIFNTIKLGILNFDREISIQRLVGASNWFIRGPFIFSGVVSGAIAGFFSFLLFGLISYFLSSHLFGFLAGFHLFDFFKKNLFKFFLLNFLTGILLAAISSFLALRRYLKI